MSVVGKKAEIKMEKVSYVVRTDKWQINNSLDKKHEPRRPDDIVRDARAQVGREFNYNVLSRNCEHNTE